MSCDRALLVSVSRFSPESELQRRGGVNRDTRRLHQVLSARGFTVTIITDPRATDILQAFRTESEQAVKSTFVGIISSHGEPGVVFGSDGVPVQLAKIYSYFGGSNMAGKTKLFLIQACRGSDFDDGVETDSLSSADEVSDLSEHFSIPADTVVMYATAPGYVAYMHPLGSFFLQSFCELLEEQEEQNGGKGGGGELELTRLLTRLNHRVAYHFQAKGRVLAGKKEMPCIVSRLTSDVFPFSRVMRKQKLVVSATELVGDELQSRKNSIS